MEREAFVSLVTNDSYAAGAIALGKSLRDTHTQRRLALLITDGVSQEMRERLSRLWDELILVEELDSGDTERLALLTRPELGVTFSKIHVWRLTQYRKCVFLDADTLVLHNVDELFDREELSAAPDIGWPDCFNSGVFVFEPSMETYGQLLALALQEGSFDGGDQGLFNLFWSDWATKDIKYHLPFIFNVVPNVTYGYAPAFQQFGRRAKIVHFIGAVKPWQHRYLRELDAVVLCPGSYASQHAVLDLIRRWWQVYCSTEQPPASSFWSPSHAWGIPSAPPPPPPHSQHHPPPYHSPQSPPITYHPASHSHVHVPYTPIFVYDVPDPSSPPATLVVSSLPQISPPISPDQPSDLVDYHFHHFSHISLSQYTPGGYGRLYMDDMYDGIPVASPSERLAPRPETPPTPTHDPNIYGSIGKDEPVVSMTLVTDSVLPYHPPPSSVPSLHDPVTQETRQEGGAEPDSKKEQAGGGTVFCDSFANIQAQLDAILDSGDDVTDNQSDTPDDSSTEKQ